MLKKLCKTVVIFSFLLNCSTAVANNFTHQNVKQANDIFEQMVRYQGGMDAINNLDNILADYDYSTNYRTQGYGYEGTDYHSNRPGNILSLISFKNKSNWSQIQRHYLEAFYSSTSIYQNGTNVDYNNITRTHTTAVENDFDKFIETQLFRNPLLILKSALTQKDSLRYLGSKINDGTTYSLIAMTLSSGRVITTYVNQNNYQIAKVEFLSKGKLNEHFYSKYKKVGQFHLPFFIKKNKPDNYYSSYFYYHVSSYDFLPNVKQLTAAPKGYVLAEKQDAYDSKLRVQTIGKGIHWLTQSGANSIFVEFEDYIMAVDANNGRNDGLKRRINKFRELVPNKPIKYVSISHHHHDHFDQVPRYVEQGTTVITAKSFIPLITQRINNFSEEITRDPIFEIVNQKRVYADDSQRVEIYELKNMLHAETMLMTYFPNDQLIYLPDHYEVGYLVENQHEIRALLVEIERLGLKVKGFISGHGNDVYSLATIKSLLAHPIEMKAFRRQPHQSVTHSE